MATIGVAIFGCLIRPVRRAWNKTGECFTANNLIIDFLNGTVVVPFILMIGSAFSLAVMQEALKTNKLFLAIGGVIGLIFVVREFFNGEPAQQVAADPTAFPLGKISNAPSKAANSPHRAQRTKPRRK